MYFNLFVFETVSPNLDAVTLMVQLSGVAATLMLALIPLLARVFKKRKRKKEGQNATQN